MRYDRNGFLARFFGLGKGRRRGDSRNGAKRNGRRLTLETLESRQLLTAAPPLALAASLNPVAAGASVTFTASAPSSDAGNNVTFTVPNQSPVSEPLQAISALQVGGTGGMTTPLALDPGSFPNMTISAWVDVNIINDGNVVSCFDGSDGGFWRGFGYGPNSDNTGYVWHVQVGDHNWLTNVAVDPGNWHLVTAVFSSTNIQFYIDGTFQESYGSPGAWGAGGGTSSTLTVGYDGYDGGSQSVDACINEVDVWQTALSTTEVLQLYNNGIGIVSDNLAAYPAAPELVAGYHLTDPTSSTTAVDFTGNGYSGSLTGDAQFASEVGFQETATYETSFSSCGYAQVTATYTAGAEDSYGNATANLDETVLNTSTTTLLGVPSTATQGQPVTLTADVSGSGDTPVGVVEFYARSTDLGSAPLSGGTAYITTTEIPSGTNETISAVYEGDNNPNMPDPSTADNYYAGSNSNDSGTSASITVSPAVVPTLTSSANPSAPDEPVMLTASLPPGASGDASFYDGATLLGTEPVVSSDALAFDGSSGLVDFGNHAWQNIGQQETTPAASVSAWVDIEGDGTRNGIVLIKQDAEGDQSAAYGLIYLAQTGKITFSLATDESGGWHDYPSQTTLALNTWYNVVGVYDGSSVKVYIDGRLDASYGGVSGQLVTGSGDLRVGMENTWSPEYLYGSVQEVGIWNAALTSSDVAALYGDGQGSGGVYPQQASMVAGWHFDEGGVSTTVHDFLNAIDNPNYDGTLSASGCTWTGSSAWDASATYTTNPSTDLTTPGAHPITVTYNGASAPAAMSQLVLDTSLSDGAINNAPPTQSTPSPLTDGALALPVAYTTGSLQYVSNSMGNATVSIDAELPATDPTYYDALTGVAVTVELNNNPSWKNTVYYAVPTGFDSGADYRFTVPIDDGLTTGTYSYSMTFKAYSADDTSGTDITSLDTSGTTNVLNWSQSPFGAGWNLDGLDQLVIDGTAGVTYVRSDGTMGFFAGSGPYTPPAGPFAFMNLVRTTFGTSNTPVYELTGTDGTMEVFYASTGYLWHVIDHDDNTTTYTWSGNKLVGILDPAGHLTQFGNNGTLITSITDFAGRETDLSYSGTQLTTVTLPDPDYNNEEQPVFNFGYDPTIGLMTSYQDANGDTSTFSYRVDGTLQTVTAADGSTVGYQSALSPPLLPGEGGGEGAVGTDSNPAALVLSATAVGIQTDQSGNPTVYTFDQFGDPTSVENALGNTTIYQRDGNGLVTEMIQPSPNVYSPAPTTEYSYDQHGMMTGEDNPDGSMQDWVYATYSTPGGLYDVPTVSGRDKHH